MIDKQALDVAGEHGDIAAQTPIDLDLIVRSQPAAAAGFPAVAHSLGHVLSQAGPVRSAQTLLSINQRNGFDCPSCAWADPEEKRALVEFCENGAKALADAITTQCADVAFFDRHSVAELSRQSDQWLNAQGRLVDPMVLEPGAAHYEPISWDDALAARTCATSRAARR